MLRLNELYRTVVVAVTVMLMMEMAIHQIVNVVTVRNHRMTAVWTMHVINCMTIAHMTRRAVRWVDVIYLESMFVNMVTVNMMQVAIMQIVYVVTMFDRLVPTVFTMLMIVIFVNLAFAHLDLPRNNLLNKFTFHHLMKCNIRHSPQFVTAEC